MFKKSIITLGVIFAMLTTQFTVLAENEIPLENNIEQQQEVVEDKEEVGEENTETLDQDEEVQDDLKEVEGIEDMDLPAQEDTDVIKDGKDLENKGNPTSESLELQKNEEPEDVEPSLKEVYQASQISSQDIDVNFVLKYQDGTKFEDDKFIEVDKDLRFEMDWSLKNDHKYGAGDTFEFNLPKQLTIHNSLNGDLGNYGTYTVDQAGHVIFTFNDKIEKESNVEGTFWFDTEFQETEITSTEETLEIVANDVVIGTVSVNIKPKGGQAISKRGQPVGGNFNTAEVDWTVIINTTRDSLINAIINDPILDGQELILDSISLKEVEVNSKGEWVKDLDEVTEFANSSTIENLNISLGDTNKAYKLTFRTKLLEKDFKEGTKNYNNTAYLSSDGKPEAQAGGSVSVSRPKTMEKSSSKFHKEDRSIEWTVNANFTEQPLKAGDVITDEFTFTVDKEEITDVFEIKSENIIIEQVDEFNENGTAKNTSDAKDLFDITTDGNKVTYKLKKNSNKAFILKYKTELKEGAYINKDGKITNKVELNGKTATGSQGIIQQVGKKTNSGINYEDKTIDWTITINADQQDLREFVLKDNFAGSGQKLVKDSIKVEPQIAPEKINVSDDKDGFEINFGDITKSYKITYQTKFVYDFEGENTPNFKNGVEISYKTKDGGDYELKFENTVTPNEETKNNGAKNGAVDQETKAITWMIDINYNQLALTNAEVLDAIPENQAFIDGTVKIYETTIEKDGTITLGADVTDTFTVDTGENLVKVDFGEIDQSYRIEFQTKDKDGIYNTNEVYKNTAQFIPREGEVHDLTANVTLPNQGEFIGKTGLHNKEDWTIDWKIDVNKSLSTTSDFTITDDLGDTSSQILLKDTIKVYKSGSETELIEGEGNDYTLTVEGNRFEIYIPGEITEAYEITYSSYIVAGETVDVTNEAKVESNDVIEGTVDKVEKVQIKISAGGGTGEGVTGGLTLKKFDEVKGLALEGVEFSLVKTVGSENIVVREGSTDVNGELNWTGLQYGEYQLQEKLPKGYTGTEEQIINISSEELEGIKIIEITNNREKGTAEIIKFDSDDENNFLEGATFLITNIETGQEYTLVTGKNGKISKEVPFGEYTVKETIAPEGYLVNEEIPNIIVEIGKTTSIDVENEVIRGNIEFSKTDVNDNKLEGAIFALYDDQGEQVGKSVASNADGLVKFENIPYGTYTVKELEAPTGYVPTEEVFEAMIEENGTTVNLSGDVDTVENILIIGSVQFTKKDNETREALAGAVFGLYDIEDTVFKEALDQQTSNSDGLVGFDDIPFGTYQVREIEAPEGYVTSEEAYRVTITDHEEVNTMLDKINTRIRGSVEFTKKDNETRQALTGATFGIYELEDTEFENVLQEQISDGDGLVRFDDIPFGTYQVREIEAPEGYVTSDEAYRVTITDHEEVNTMLDKINTRIRGSVQFTKRDAETEEVITGAIFGIYELEDTEFENVLQEQISDGNGLVRFDGIAFGDYNIREVRASKGYVTSKEAYPVTITEHEEVVTIDDQLNNLILANLQFIKKSDTGKLLSGAEFSIYTKEDTEFEDALDTVKSDESGLVRFENVLFGDYVIKETKAPEGHLISDKLITVAVTERNHDKTISFKNYENIIMRSDIEILKTDAYGNVLEGAEFALYDTDDELVGENVLSDKNGMVVFKDVAYGTYTIKEVKAPKGYKLSTEILEVEIKKDSTVVKADVNDKALVFENIEYGRISIQKVDADNEDLVLEGAIFEIRDLDGKLIATVTTDTDGRVLVEDLEYGDYKVVEIQAPKGYVLDERVYTVTVNGEEEGIHLEASLTITNNLEPEEVIPVDPEEPGDVEGTKRPEESDPNLPTTGISNTGTIMSMMLVGLGFILTIFSRKKKES